MGRRHESFVAEELADADKGPVLVSWPMAFLFPCVGDVATVTAGVASTPRAVIESPDA